MSASGFAKQNPMSFTATAPRAALLRAYTPDGGSLLLNHASRSGKTYLALERMLMSRGDLYLFESAYSARIFHDKIGRPGGLVRIVHNGVTTAEFAPVALAPDAADLEFLGEFPVKGIDVLIDAIASLYRGGSHITATLVGDGPEAAALSAQVSRLGLAGAIRFAPPIPARGNGKRRDRGDPFARGVVALCGAGSRRGRKAADHYQCWRHSGNLGPAFRDAGASRRPAKG